MRNFFAVQSWFGAATGRLGTVLGSVRRSSRPRSASQSMPLPAQRALSEQWSRVSLILADAQTRAHFALERHKGASAQLDAATYALQRLHEEIAPAFFFTVARAPSAPPVPTAFRREQFRRREPLAA